MKLIIKPQVQLTKEEKDILGHAADIFNNFSNQVCDDFECGCAECPIRALCDAKLDRHSPLDVAEFLEGLCKLPTEEG